MLDDKLARNNISVIRPSGMRQNGSVFCLLEFFLICDIFIYG